MGEEKAVLQTCVDIPRMQILPEMYTTSRSSSFHCSIAQGQGSLVSNQLRYSEFWQLQPKIHRCKLSLKRTFVITAAINFSAALSPLASSLFLLLLWLANYVSPINSACPSCPVSNPTNLDIDNDANLPLVKVSKYGVIYAGQQNNMKITDYIKRK